MHWSSQSGLEVMLEPLERVFFHNNVILVVQVGRGGKPKYNDHIIDGGGGLETAKNG